MLYTVSHSAVNVLRESSISRAYSKREGAVIQPSTSRVKVK